METAAQESGKESLSTLRQSFLLLLFSFSLFLSAAAMFVIQPMMGKMLLPRIGGTPAGWIAAVAFFQSMLLLGYLFAHGMARFSPRLHGACYLALMAAGACLLPVSLPAEIDASDIDAGGVFMLLLSAAGVPFIALSATAATLQRLFLTTDHAQAGDPYFLYAASNLGSFAGLLLYPLMIEPLSTLDMQAQGWFFAYAFLIPCATACLAAGLRKPPLPAPAQTLPTIRDMLHWAFIAFVPSALFLAVTTHIVTDIVSAPLVWVLPLALYLLSFVMAFGRRQIVDPAKTAKAAPPVIAFAFAHVLLLGSYLSSSFAALGLHVACFFVIALACHQRLAAARPDAAHLTAFYLMIAVGGALGGALNAFAAPLVFNTLAEYPLLLLAAGFALPAFRGAFTGKKARILLLLVLGSSVGWLLLTKAPQATSTAAVLLLALATYAVIYPRILIALAVVFLAAGQTFYAQDKKILSERNFFGVLRISERSAEAAGGEKYLIREFMHGSTLHGFQIMEPREQMLLPVSYYHPALSPLAEVMGHFAPLDVAVVGLGAGTLACYEKQGRHFTFFEIDPAVVRLAQEHFTFLSGCPGSRPHRLVTGDGRIALAADVTAFYDLIILDAFSSDAIPSHLVTLEAVQTYLARLDVGGLIVFNISSRYFDMVPILAAAAHNAGLSAIYKEARPGKDLEHVAQASRWLVMGADHGAIADFAAAHDWRGSLSGSASPWRDNFSNILGVLRR